MLARFCAEDIWELGLDEVGIGSIAGPVVVAAVVLPPHLTHPDIRDSKKLSPKKRELVADFIQEHALAFAVVMKDNLQVDLLNPIRAAINAMHDCVSIIQKSHDQTSIKSLFLLVDGRNFLEYPNLKHFCVVKGDAIYLSIAAASILAKVYRDRYMCWMHDFYPHYNWKSNKGYPTPEHLKAITYHRISTLHRKNIKFKNKPELQEKYKFIDTDRENISC